MTNSFTKAFYKLLLFVCGWFAWGPARAVPVRQPLLWSVERGGARSYLFGTLHVGIGLSDLPRAVTEALDASSSFVMETDLRAIEAGAFKSLATLPTGVKLEDLLPPESWAALRAAFEGKVAAEALNTYRPWYVASQLVRLAATTHGMSVDLPLDVALRDYAEARLKQKLFLEAWQLQFVTLDAMTTAYDLYRMLQPAPRGGRDNLQGLFDAYVTGDERRLEPFAEPNTAESGFNEEQVYLLLTNRNAHWVSVIDRLCARESAFVAVGALHLPGPQGLLALLRARGYRVQRVAAQPRP